MDVTEEPQLQAKFFTKQEQYSLPSDTFSIPISYGVSQLSTLLNQLLNEDGFETQINFDFLINDEFVRVSLEEHLRERNLLTDNAIEIEYVESTSPPTPSDSIVHDDWVTAVRATDRFILSGAYDNVVRIWTMDGQLVHSVAGHKAVVKGVAWLKDEDDDAEKRFVSASHDGTARLWQWNENAKSVNCLGIGEIPKSSHEHLERSIDSVDASPNKTMFATGSQNCLLNIWSAEPSSDDEKPKKKRKTEKHVSPVMVPLTSLEGHSQCVSSVCWVDNKTVCSASWDHTIHLWDLRKDTQKFTITGTKVFFDVRYSPLSQLLVTASADRHVRLYDQRASGGAAVKCTFSSHSLWVSCVDWSPVSEYHFVSGSHDKMFKLWDMRSPKAPLFDMRGHEDKILCADWSVQERMISGGADKHIRIFRNSGSLTNSDEL